MRYQMMALLSALFLCSAMTSKLFFLESSYYFIHLKSTNVTTSVGRKTVFILLPVEESFSGLK